MVGLIRTGFLKRFESSVAAFELSCDRLLKKLLAFIEVHSESDAEQKRLERWKAQNAEIFGYVAQRQLEIWGEDTGEDEDEDIVPQEILDAVEHPDRDAILEEPGEIVASIRSRPNTPRKCTMEEKTLVDLGARVEKQIKNTYLKRVDAPVGVKPALRCWMELCE